MKRCLRGFGPDWPCTERRPTGMLEKERTLGGSLLNSGGCCGQTRRLPGRRSKLVRHYEGKYRSCVRSLKAVCRRWKIDYLRSSARSNRRRTFYCVGAVLAHALTHRAPDRLGEWKYLSAPWLICHRMYGLPLVASDASIWAMRWPGKLSLLRLRSKRLENGFVVPSADRKRCCYTEGGMSVDSVQRTHLARSHC